MRKLFFLSVAIAVVLAFSTFALVSAPSQSRPPDVAAEVKRLRRENAELRRANEILKAAAAFFGAELDRPQQRW